MWRRLGLHLSPLPCYGITQKPALEVMDFFTLINWTVTVKFKRP